MGIKLNNINDIYRQDCIIIAVGHEEYSNFTKADWSRMLKENGVIIDVKSLYDKNKFIDTNIRHWRL